MRRTINLKKRKVTFSNSLLYQSRAVSKMTKRRIKVRKKVKKASTKIKEKRASSSKIKKTAAKRKVRASIATKQRTEHT